MKMKTKTLFAAMSFLTICSMDAQAQIPQQASDGISIVLSSMASEWCR